MEAGLMKEFLANYRSWVDEGILTKYILYWWK